MFDLDNLYSDHKLKGENPLCEGCTILSKNKPCNSIMDYEQLEESPALFHHWGGTEFPENAFMYVGTIDEAKDKAKTMNK